MVAVHVLAQLKTTTNLQALNNLLSTKSDGMFDVQANEVAKIWK